MIFYKNIFIINQGAGTYKIAPQKNTSPRSFDAHFPDALYFSRCVRKLEGKKSRAPVERSRARIENRRVGCGCGQLIAAVDVPAVNRETRMAHQHLHQGARALESVRGRVRAAFGPKRGMVHEHHHAAALNLIEGENPTQSVEAPEVEPPKGNPRKGGEERGVEADDGECVPKEPHKRVARRESELRQIARLAVPEILLKAPLIHARRRVAVVIARNGAEAARFAEEVFQKSPRIGKFAVRRERREVAAEENQPGRLALDGLCQIGQRSARIAKVPRPAAKLKFAERHCAPPAKFGRLTPRKIFTNVNVAELDDAHREPSENEIDAVPTLSLPFGGEM